MKTQDKATPNELVTKLAGILHRIPESQRKYVFEAIQFYEGGKAVHESAGKFLTYIRKNGIGMDDNEFFLLAHDLNEKFQEAENA